MDSATTNAQSVLRITVKNHSGVLSHICGLFARRAYSIEGIISVPQGAAICQVFILVNENEKLDQVIRQTQKLVDVIKVYRCDADLSLFQGVSAQLDSSIEVVASN